MKMVNLRRPPVGVNLQGASYFGGMADVNDHVARVAAAGGGDVDEPELTQFAREVVAMDPAPSLAWSAACGYEAGTLFALDPEDGSGDFAVTRAGTTAFTQTPDNYWKPAAANEPRFTYTAGVRGLLVEGAATRLNADPYSIEKASWTKSGITVDTNSGAGYDSIFVDANGINTKQGRKLVNTNQNVAHRILLSTAISITGVVALTVFCKKAEFKKIGIQNNVAGGGQWMTFNIDTKTKIDGTEVSWSATDSVDGWVKLVVIMNSGTTTYNPYIYPLPDAYTSGNPGLYSSIGNNINGLYIGGVFVESGTVASSPIGGAEGATQTRNADVETVNVPAGVTQIILTNMNDVETIVTSFSSPYQIPVGTWKSIIMK